jgi:hypothetical protein
MAPSVQKRELSRRVADSLICEYLGLAVTFCRVFRDVFAPAVVGEFGLAVTFCRVFRDESGDAQICAVLRLRCLNIRPRWPCWRRLFAPQLSPHRSGGTCDGSLELAGIAWGWAACRLMRSGGCAPLLFWNCEPSHEDNAEARLARQCRGGRLRDLSLMHDSQRGHQPCKVCNIAWAPGSPRVMPASAKYLARREPESC